MARILITSARQAGFVLPLLQVARALTARGDEVTVLTGSEFAPQVEAAGARFARLPYDDVAPPAAVRPVRNRSGVREMARLLERLFLDPIEIDHRTVLTLSASLGIDAVITEPLFVGSSIIGLLPRGQRPAVLSIGFFPLPFSSRDTPPYGLGLSPGTACSASSPTSRSSVASAAASPRRCAGSPGPPCTARCSTSRSAPTRSRR